MLLAAREIMVAEGMDAVTHQRVAEVAGIGRATVYRHWPAIDELILAVFDRHSFPSLEEGEEGDFPARLRRNLMWIVAFYTSVVTRPMALAMAERAQWNERMRELLDRLVTQKERNLEIAIQQAPAEVRAGLISEDSSTLVSMLIGPIYYRSMLQDEVIDETFIDTLIDSVFRA